jgi:hypothetical protein
MAEYPYNFRLIMTGEQRQIDFTGNIANSD